MPVKLRSSVGPIGKSSLPFKKRESDSKNVMKKMSVTDYTRERDLRIEPPKRTKITKLKKEAVTPRRSPRNANKRRTIMTRSTKTDSL